MIPTYILILFISMGGGTSATVTQMEFKGKTRCQTAGVEARTEFKKAGTVHFVCVEK